VTSPYCEKVKIGDSCITDFAAFLHHVAGCDDCIRRIKNQIIIKFKQREK
jgi:hypothetical protein